MKLSIIIPVYKVEAYIEKCLLSIMQQDLNPSEFEVICINDGSPDRSADIILSFQQRYPNVIFINQENQGVSVARNRGLDIAKGKYIAFIDPDDSIYPNSIKPILEKADQHNIEVLYLGFELVDEQGNYMRTVESNGQDDIVQDGFSHPRRTFPATLYSRKIIGEIRYIQGIPRGQDTVFNVMVHALAQNVSYFSRPYYKYLQRETSSRQHVGTEKTFLGCLLAVASIQSFQKDKFPNPTPTQKAYFNDAMLTFVRRAIEWNILPGNDRARFEKLKRTLNDAQLNYLVKQAAAYFKYFDRNWYVFLAFRMYRSIVSKLNATFK